MWNDPKKDMKLEDEEAAYCSEQTKGYTHLDPQALWPYLCILHLHFSLPFNPPSPHPSHSSIVSILHSPSPLTTSPTMMQQSSQILHLPRNGELGSLFFLLFWKKEKMLKLSRKSFLMPLPHLIEVLMPLLRINKGLIRLGFLLFSFLFLLFYLVFG